MTYDEYEPLINRLAALFPQRPVPPATVAAYWEMLSDINGDVFAQAVRSCAVSCDWFPTVKQLRHAAEDAIMATIPDPMEQMRRFPHRISSPLMRAIVTYQPSNGDTDADPRTLRSRDSRRGVLPETPRRLNGGERASDGDVLPDVV